MRAWARRRTWLVLASVTSGVAGALAGAFTHFELPGPDDAIDEAPAQMSRVLDRDGAGLATLAREKRLLLEAHEIPESFALALIASEDSRFNDHVGVDAIGVGRALASCLRRGRCEGASTLSMQLAGMLFLDRSERTPARKLGEVLLAVEIERRYTKREILAHYANHVHFGHGLEGLEAASRFYCGKPARQLRVDESAMLVGLLPSPARYSPRRDPELARHRRNLVLRRMVEERQLTREEGARLSKLPLALAPELALTDEPRAPHFIEGVRRRLVERLGEESLYRDGLVVHTTLDSRLQVLAERVIAQGLERSEHEGALVALDPRTGAVLALVGGREARASTFDRATQARRQPGSLFKPFVVATALGLGWSLGDVLTDEPTVFIDRQAPRPYQPENFEGDYRGAITLRETLVHSVNIPTVELLRRVGAPSVIDTARRLGHTGPLAPYPSLALGAFEASLLELTSAYGAFANGGLWLEPHCIARVDDRLGRTLFEAAPAVREATDPRVAFLMNQALAGVITDGTGRSAGHALAGRTLAGKTGTTDRYTDAWFIGYTPSLAVGVWVGRDRPASLGPGATGARVALPLWIEFMREATRGTADEPFTVPPGIAAVTIDPRTGLRARADAGCRGARLEHYLAGTEPVEGCSAARHAHLALPYPFQRYPLDAAGRLEIPRAELERLLLEEPSVRFDRRGGALHTVDSVALAVTLVEGGDDPPGPARDPETVPRGLDGRRARIAGWP